MMYSLPSVYKWVLTLLTVEIRWRYLSYISYGQPICYCQGRRTGVAVTIVSNSLVLGGWVTKVLKNGDKN